MKSSYRVIIIIVLAVSQNAFANENAKYFFDTYIKLSDAFDASVVDLYSDNAKVHAYRVYPHGLERSMELSGWQWKQLIIKSMPIAKAQNDISGFSNIIFIEHGTGYKIKANRYSEKKCYTDSGYYMIVEPNDNGRLQIIEEYMETQPQSNC